MIKEGKQKQDMMFEEGKWKQHTMIKEGKQKQDTMFGEGKWKQHTMIKEGKWKRHEQNELELFFFGGRGGARGNEGHVSL
jgi:hypothetical protein